MNSFYFLSGMCPRFTSVKEYAGYTFLIDLSLVFIVRLMFCQPLLFSFAITVAAFPMRAFISTTSVILLEMVDPKHLKLTITEPLEPSIYIDKRFRTITIYQIGICDVRMFEIYTLIENVITVSLVPLSVQDHKGNKG